MSSNIEPTEEQVERAWAALEVSPNTIQAIARLIAELDASKAAHDADRLAWSGVAKEASSYAHVVPVIRDILRPFILPDPEPADPLVEVIEEMRADGSVDPTAADTAAALRVTLAKHNLEIRETGK